MKGENLDRKPVIATMAASALMLTFGLMYKGLAMQFSSPVNKTPIDPTALDGFPMQVGSWIGEDVHIDDAVVRRTRSDAHINRRYSRSSSLDSVSFYVACGIKVDEVMSHRPEGCYTSAGWTLVHRHSTELISKDGTKLPCTIFQFSRADLNTEKVMVLNYFLVDGQYCADVSLLRSRIWRLRAKVDYVAQVQLVASIESLTGNSAERLVSTFAVDSAASIANLFEDIDRIRRLPKKQ